MSAELSAALRVDRTPDTLRIKTTDILRHAISTGLFAAGSRLVERKLCDYTGVSRTIIRESLRHLEAEGLVVVQPNRGPVVSTLTRSQIEQIHQVREALEPLCAKLFTEHADHEAMSQLEIAYAALDKAFQGADPKLMTVCARQVFRAIYDHCGNEFMAETLNRLTARVQYLRELSISQEGRIPKSAAEMLDLIKALRERDGVKAAHAALVHARAASESALRAFDDRASRSQRPAVKKRGRPRKVT